MKNKDSLLRFKYIGYCLAMLPPEDIKFSDFVNYAKFNLCMKNHILMKDSVWDNYTDEDILVEYFAFLYYSNEKIRSQFEGILNGESEDLMDWFKKMEAKNKEDLDNYLREVPDDLSLKPISSDNGD